MSVTVLPKEGVQERFNPILSKLGDEFAEQNNLPSSDEVFVEAQLEEFRGKEYVKAFIFLGDYMYDPYTSPIGAYVYIGSQGGLSYKTKNGLLKECSSIINIIRLASKFYTGNTMPCRITIDLGLPKGNNLKADERIRKLLLSIGATDPKIKIEYDVKKE